MIHYGRRPLDRKVLTVCVCVCVCVCLREFCFPFHSSESVYFSSVISHGCNRTMRGVVDIHIDLPSGHNSPQLYGRRGP